MRSGRYRDLGRHPVRERRQSARSRKTATDLARPDAEEGLAPKAGEDTTVWRPSLAATPLGLAFHAVLRLGDMETGERLEDIARAQSAAERIPERAGDIATLARAAWACEPAGRASTLRHWLEVPSGAPVEAVMLEGFINLI
ncbi:MAG TPA: hypothetical protein VNF75_07420 [Candidatus Dormibacteraeota bacterium]|nr:hypothetical protein [Candidatus Dormibacteraeota bacterium]